jgi:hypothetical protein
MEPSSLAPQAERKTDDLDGLLQFKARLLEIRQNQPARARLIDRQLHELQIKIEQAQGQAFLF